MAIKKVQIGFDESALEVITRLQKASGATTMAEVLRSALGFYDWAREKVEAGYAVGAMKEDHPIVEVVVFRGARKVSKA